MGWHAKVVLIGEEDIFLSKLDNNKEIKTIVLNVIG